MKNFDEERAERHHAREVLMGDRTFVFGGETFSYRANVQYDVLGEISQMTTETDGGRVIRTLEETVVDLIEGDEATRTRFIDICHNKDTDLPVTFQDLNDLATWLIEAQVQGPTIAPLSSTDGDARTSTGSTENSSSVPEEASAA